MRSVRPVLMMLLLCLGTFMLPSCSGDGTSGTDPNGSITLSSLILPDSVSVVDPKTQPDSSPSAKSIKSLIFGMTTLGLDPASDYRSDRTTVYVNERSLDSFRTVSEILCMVRQSRYDVMLNKGPYIAQVDKNLCSSERSNASSAGQATTNQSASATMPMYENWTVNSIRTNSQSPQVVQAWVHSLDNYSGKTSLVFAKIIITEGADTAPPYGVFKMNFKFYDPADLSTILARGFLNAERDANGEVLLYFATEDKDSYEIQKATLNKDIVNNTGAGTVYNARTKPGDTFSITRYNIAYDAGNFLRSDSTSSICLDRDNIVESSWRYGLYTTGTNSAVAPGTRVTRNSNFQVKKGSVYGSIGYWGAWFPSINGTPVTVSDGDLVSKHDYSNNTDTAYTVFQRAGKLKKYTRKDVTLNDIKNIPLVLFTNGTTYMVAWDGSKFWVVAAQSQSDGSWISGVAPYPFLLDLSSLSWVELGFWSQALGGSVIVKLHDPATNHNCTTTSPYNCSTAADATTPVIYYKEDIIFPGDPVPSQLACFDRCPDAAKLDTADPYYDTSLLSYQTVTPSLAVYKPYSFVTTGASPTAMVLTDGGTPVTATTTTSPYTNGITSGILTSPTSTYWNLLACPWNPGNTCPGQAWTVLPEFYVWETGPNTWNQFVTVRDGGGIPVRFDAPLQVKYIHSQPTATAPDAKYNGVTFFLQYSGFGDLQGIPGKCVNIDTGLDANCSEAGTNQAIRWVPEFSIPAATETGDLTEVMDIAQPSITYFVKALETEQRLGPGGTCAGLTATAYQLPSMSFWIDPVIGPEPVITAPPAVVGGVVQ